MRNIMIVGAGQSGLQLALSLQKRGYAVSVTSNRSADDIRAGKVLSSQCMFHDSLQHERDRGLNFWESECPTVDGISFVVPHPEIPGEKALSWSHRLDHYAQSVDQRVKVPGWINEFERRGGEILYKEASIEDMEQWTQTYDLVIVAAGKGAIAQMFERDAQRSPYDKPQRALALTYVHGMTPRDEFSAVSFNLIPGVGEYFVFPALTTTGPCDIMVFEGVPGGPMDCWGDVQTPGQHLARSRQILQQYLPWEAQRCERVELTDSNGILTGRFAPTVRKLVGKLPSGRVVMGMADAVVLNDPITGQGSNNAAKFTHAVEIAIVGHADKAFDADFMNNTFESFWQSYGSHATNWTNAMLMPPPPHVMNVLGAASMNANVARRIVNGFNNPTDFTNFFMTPDKADQYLAEVMPA